MSEHDRDRVDRLLNGAQLDRIEQLAQWIVAELKVTREAIAHHAHSLKRQVDNMGTKTDAQLARISADVGKLGTDLTAISAKLNAVIGTSDDATALQLKPIADALDAVTTNADALAAATAPPVSSGKPVVSLTVTPKVLALKTGGVGNLAVVALDADGNVVADAVVTFASDNAAATADPDGRVHGAAVGNAVVTASVGAVSDTCAVSVTS